jgi:hypothetical protein
MGMGIPGGYVGITLRAVLDAGADPDAVTQWVRDNGGTSRRTPAIQSQGLRPGRVLAQEKPPVPYFLIPLSSLE